MKISNLIKNLAVILLLVFTASGVVSAKVASGPQNLSAGLHQAESLLDSLPRLGWDGFSYDEAPGSSVVTKSVTPNAQQAANLKRFQKKIPSNSKDSVELRELPNGGVAAQATSPGKVPGSKAVYEKQIDVNGKTVQATKTTYDPQGNIVHVKDKLNGGTYP